MRIWAKILINSLSAMRLRDKYTAQFRSKRLCPKLIIIAAMIKMPLPELDWRQSRQPSEIPPEKRLWRENQMFAHLRYWHRRIQKKGAGFLNYPFLYPPWCISSALGLDLPRQVFCALAEFTDIPLQIPMWAEIAIQQHQKRTGQLGKALIDIPARFLGGYTGYTSRK